MMTHGKTGLVMGLALLVAACGGGGGSAPASTGTAGGAGSADQMSVAAFLQALDNQLAVSTSAADPALRAYFDLSRYLDDGETAETWMPALIAATAGRTLTVSDVVLAPAPDWAKAAIPVGATASYGVTWTTRQGSQAVDRRTTVVYQTGGHWLLLGNQQFTEAWVEASEISWPMGSGRQYCSGLDLHLGGGAAEPTHADYAVVTGPGLPTAGVLLVNNPTAGEFFVAGGTYAGRTLTPAAGYACGQGGGYHQLSDTAIAAIPANAVYTLRIYDDKGTPADRTDDGPLAAYTSTLPAPPLLSTTLNATHFPAAIAASPSITSLANTGGATTVSWGAPTGTTQFPYFLSATITYPDMSTDMRDADLHGATSIGLTVGAHGQPSARTLFTLQSTDTDFRAYLYQTEGVY